MHIDEINTTRAELPSPGRIEPSSNGGRRAGVQLDRTGRRVMWLESREELLALLNTAGHLLNQWDDLDRRTALDAHPSQRRPEAIPENAPEAEAPSRFFEPRVPVTPLPSMPPAPDQVSSATPVPPSAAALAQPPSASPALAQPEPDHGNPRDGGPHGARPYLMATHPQVQTQAPAAQHPHRRPVS